MSTKKIPAQTIVTILGEIKVNDWRNEDDNSGERTAALVAIPGTFTINNKTYSDVTLYLYRGNSYSGPHLSEYGYRGQLTDKAREKVSEELLKLPQLAEYLEVLDEDEKMRLKIDSAERQIIADSYKALQGISKDDAVDIFKRLTEKLEDNQTMSQIYFGR